MTLGIKPTVDFAFMKVFGSPENSLALTGLLNAILELEDPIAGVEIVNPFNPRPFLSGKQMTLKVQARDSAGRPFNVEMQVAIHRGVLRRLTYSTCQMYADQLSSAARSTGIEYARLRPAMSIVLLDQVLSPDAPAPLHHFRLLDRSSGRQLRETIEMYVVELPTYDLDEATISAAGKLDQWVFLLKRAANYSADQLRRLLPGEELLQAIGAMEAMSSRVEDRAMHDQCERAQRDRERALLLTHEDGREEGRDEGKLDGQIQLMQQLLGESSASDDELRSLSMDERSALAAKLRARLLSRAAIDRSSS